MDFWQIIMTPFSWLLKVLCQFTNSYGIALILFTLVIKVVLFPLSLKGKRSMIKMNMASSQLKEIQRRCGNDRDRYNEEVQKYYTENNISPLGGCGWSLIPLAILMPLYAIIRRPFKYLMKLTDEQSPLVATAIGVTDFTVGAGYGELTLASKLTEKNLAAAQAAVGTAAAGLFVINFDFFGLNLADIPQWKFWENGISWNSVGLFLLPLISAGLTVLSTVVSQKTNNMGKTETDSTTDSTNKSMLFMNPILSLWIGFSMPAGLCIYWIANSLLGMVQEIICGRMLKKDYEAAQRIQEERALKAKEEEREQRRLAAERKAAAIAANKGKVKKVQPGSKTKGLEASREGLRAYARGRAYDPDRYPITPYHDPDKKDQTAETASDSLTEEEEKLLAEATVQNDTPVAEAEPAAVEEAQDGYEESYAAEAEDDSADA